jgi:t-SNARE complex subunit (syntaxin)
MEDYNVVSESEREHVHQKTDAQLQTIIEQYVDNPSNSLRQVAMEEKYIRSAKKNRWTNLRSWFGIIISILSLIVSIIAIASRHF